MENKRNPIDDFWDIESLIPEKKHPSPFVAHSYDTEPVEVILTAKESTSDDKTKTIEMRPTANNKLTFPSLSEKIPAPDDEYVPDNPFIKNVKVFKRKDFSYYSGFYEDGIRYLSRTGFPCSEPSFFSWVPQYSQLGRSQLDFYFYLRDCLRSKKSIDASYSYILLYIFELINIEPNKKNALSQLCFVWKSYRKKYPKLDPLMREWITDFCFIHHLSPNAEALGDAYSAALEYATVKELFVCGGKYSEEMAAERQLTQALLSLCTNYDWRKSKFATEENVPIYKKHIFGALKAVLSSMKGKESIFVGAGDLKREAFVGAICTPNNKYKLEVSHCSLARSYEMRFLITDVIKHTENKIRAYLGVKSRLTVYSLPINVRGIIDAYMDSELRGKRILPKKEEPEEYEKLYDAPKHEFSLENAKKIEEASWGTTKLLIEAFNSEELSEAPPLKKVEREEQTDEFNDEALSDEEKLIKSLLPYKDFMKAVITPDAKKQEEAAKVCGRITDALADKINEIAADIFGDIILEKDGSVYTVIEDYKEVFGNECFK